MSGKTFTYKGKYLQTFCLLLTARAGWCLPSLYLQLVNRNGKHFVLRDQPWRQTSWMSLFLIRDRLLVIVGVFPLLPPLPISPLPTSPHGLRASFLESPTSCSADGLAGIAVRSAMSPAVASRVRMKLRFWDLFLPRLHPGCK